MFKHFPCRIAHALFTAAIAAASPTVFAQSDPGSNKDVVIRESGVGWDDSDAAAATFDRNELVIVVTRHAWNLELAGPAGSQYVIIKSGHDSAVTCSDTALQAHLVTYGTPGSSGIDIWAGDFEWESDTSSSPVYHQTTTWSAGGGSNNFGGTVTVSAKPEDTDLDWSTVGATQTFRLNASAEDTALSSYTYSVSTRVESHGIYGASVYTVVEDDGFQTEYLTETIEVFGLQDANGTAANAVDPQVVEPVGCCVIDCGVVEGISSTDCMDRGGTWENESTCTSVSDSTFCGGGTISDPTLRDDILYMDGDIDPFDQNCGGDDEPGSGTPTHVYNGLERVAPAPIEQTTGEKIETVTDIAIDLSGTEFKLTRRYRSRTNTSNTLLGNAWAMGVFSFLDVDTSGSNPVLTLKAPQGFVEFTETSGTWSTDDGPTDQTIIKTVADFDDTSDGYPVWRLKEPGGWQVDFHRLPDMSEGGLASSLPPTSWEGLPYQRIDFMGNRWTFDYESLGGEPRLHTIVFERHTATGSFEAEAKVMFAWKGASENTNAGRLRKVTVLRPDGSSWYESNRVEYLYVDDLQRYRISDTSHLGTTGDLVQVIVAERLDDDGSTPVFRERITQYRYHDGNDDELVSADTNGNMIYGEKGEEHELMAVFNAFEVEYFAEHYRQGGSTKLDLRNAAIDLHKLDLDDIAFSATTLDIDGSEETQSIRVARLASKLITRYESGKVKTQYLQASCGCGGSGTGSSMQGQLGIRRDYTYWQDADPNPTYFTFEVTESSVLDGSNPDPMDEYRIYRTHHEADTAGGVPRLTIESITDAQTTSNVWVKAYLYTSKGELKAVLNPSAINPGLYDSDGGVSGQGKYTAYEDQGHVMGYAYNSESRLTDVYFRAGYKDTEDVGHASWTLLESFTYATGMNAPRPDLIKTHTRYRTASSTGDDDEEVITYEYKFWVPATGSALTNQFSDAIMASKAILVERELTAENGPGIGTYDTKVIFDTNGRVVLELAADGSMTEYFYSGDSELLTKIVRNQATASWTAPSTGFSVVDHTGAAASVTPFTGRSDGGTMTTEYERDQLGRVIRHIAPGGITTYTYRTMQTPPSRDNGELAYYTEITLPPPVSGSGGNYTAYAHAANQTWFDASDLTAEVRSFELGTVSATDYRENALSHLNGLTPATRAAMNIDWSNKNIERRVWHDASDDDAYYLSQAQFDEYGRTLWTNQRLNDFTIPTADPVNEFTEYTYDVMDRVKTIKRGTDRSGGMTDDMVVVVSNYYDSDGSTSDGIGDSNLTFVEQHVDGSTTRDTAMYYDDRNRLVFVDNPLAPHSYTKYDNLNRPIEQHQLSVIETGDITSLSQSDRTKRIRSTYTSYSQRGIAFRTGVEIDPTSLPDSDLLVNDTWFDEVGRAVKSQPHSGPGTKIAFDGLGRAVHRFIGDMTGDGSTFANVYDTTNHEPVVSGDVILAETVNQYITTSSERGHGKPELVARYERAHDASSTGSLSNFDGTGIDSTAVATFTVYIYDEVSRVAKSGFVGTNDSAGYVAGGTAPSLGTTSFGFGNAIGTMPSNALATETLYDERGRAYVSIAPDPSDTRTRTIFDDLDRTIGIVENDQASEVAALTWSSSDKRWDLSSASTSADVDRVTSFVYDAAGNLTKRVAHVDNVDVQETLYDYSYSGSVFSSNSLLSAVHYPNESDGEADTDPEYTVAYEYNRQRDMTKMTDQNGTVHEYVHDALGRVTLDKVTTFYSTELDDTVQAIETLYSSSTGLVEYVTSYDGTNPATDTVLNQIKYEYDSLLQLSKYHQNPTGEVGTGQSADVEYVYDRAATGSGNYSRLDTIKYPFVNTGGKQRTEVSQYFGSTTFPTDLDHRISRSGGLDWTFQMKSVATDEIRYEHLGLNNTVIVDYPDGKIILDRQVDPNYTPGGGTGPRVSGEYAGMDQYGRLGRQVWYKGSTWDPDNLPARIDVAYAYDSNSDITRRYDNRVGASMSDRGDEYDYDGLNRLELATRGAPGSGGSWTSASKTEDWTLDTFGNWTAYSDSIGTSYTEDRTHNEANEITSIEVDSTTPTLEVTYDAAGNLRTRETVADSMRWVYTWDAWNRLVKVEIQEYKAGAWLTPVDRMESTYYGMNQRAWSRIDKGAAGYTTGGPDEVLNREEHFYYDASWRLLERRTDTSWSSGTGFVHEQTTQWVWGNRYIDELVAYAVDTVASTSEFDTVTYAMTDRNFSVIGLVGSERIRYDAYGYAQASPYGDVNGDGTVDTSDQTIINAAFGDSVGDAGYQVEGDLNFDGTVGTADQTLYSSASGDSIDRGRLSGEGNIIGYAGYVFEPATGLYLVRHRWYSAERGRWMNSDPLGYIDNQNLFEYCESHPIVNVDSSGLSSGGPARYGHPTRHLIPLLPNPITNLPYFFRWLAPNRTDPVDLGRTHPVDDLAEIRALMSRIEAVAQLACQISMHSLACPPLEEDYGTFSLSGHESYDLTFSSTHFHLGKGFVFYDIICRFSCATNKDCGDGTTRPIQYDCDCTILYLLVDRFEDPLDLGEWLNAPPYVQDPLWTSPYDYYQFWRRHFYYSTPML